MSECEEIKMAFKLENFEGPLDLLLEIIKQNKLDIQEIKLADITDQYLAYIAEIGSLDMEKASEFITMAATLIEIKSKSLLPRPDEFEEEQEDSEKLLLQHLKEYKLFKEASEELHNIEEVNRMYKTPDKDACEPRFVLKDMVLDKLLDAFVNIFSKVEVKQEIEEPKKIQKDRFTVEDKMASIKFQIKIKHSLNFSELFEDGQTKSELINIFLALLELIKLQIVYVFQPSIFDEIKIFEVTNQGEDING